MSLYSKIPYQDSVLVKLHFLSQEGQAYQLNHL